MNRPIALTLLASLLLLTSGCSSFYYSYLEKVGIPKREVLVNRVMDARESQEDAKEQFVDALEEFRALVSVGEPELQRTYDKLAADQKRSEARAKEVRDRIASIRDVGGKLFKEWENELGEYTNPELRANSERQLRETQRSYGEMMSAMDRVASSMDPVLAAFRDQVLVLKHNLNAVAIASLEGESAILEQNVAALITDMEASIAEANVFLERWEGARGK